MEKHAKARIRAYRNLLVCCPGEIRNILQNQGLQAGTLFLDSPVTGQPDDYDGFGNDYETALGIGMIQMHVGVCYE